MSFQLSMTLMTLHEFTEHFQNILHVSLDECFFPCSMSFLLICYDSVLQQNCLIKE